VSPETRLRVEAINAHAHRLTARSQFEAAVLTVIFGAPAIGALVALLSVLR
jgi:hypothetical protein